MKITNLIPVDSVNQYVDRILVIENVSVTTPFALPLFANGTPTLLFISEKATIKKQPTGYLTLFGQTVVPELMHIPNNFMLIAYFFKPFTLFSLFGISGKELTDCPVDLGLLDCTKAGNLAEKLLNTEITSARIKLLDNYILSLVNKMKAESELIKHAASLISNNPSKHSLINVQKELCITERTFERLFDKNIGVSPNLFRRICQFNNAFQQLNNRRFYTLTDVAFENGYADQSHFIRVFKEFTHSTPKEYLKFGDNA